MQAVNNPDNISMSNTNNSSHDELPQSIQKFDKMGMKEIEPTTQNINESIYEEDLSIVVDELNNLYFKMVNEGKYVRKQHILDNINNHKINLKEIYNWLLNNQNNSNQNTVIQILIGCLDILIIMELKLMLISKRRLNYIKPQQN